MVKTQYPPSIRIIKKIITRARQATEPKTAKFKLKKDIFFMSSALKKLKDILGKELAIDQKAKNNFEKLDHLIVDLEDELEEEGSLTPLHKDIEEIDCDMKMVEDIEIDMIRNNKQVVQYLGDACAQANSLKELISDPVSLATRLHRIVILLTVALRFLNIDVKEDKELMDAISHVHKQLKIYGVESDLDKVWQSDTEKRFYSELLESA